MVLRKKRSVIALQIDSAYGGKTYKEKIGT